MIVDISLILLINDTIRKWSRIFGNFCVFFLGITNGPDFADRLNETVLTTV